MNTKEMLRQVIAESGDPLAVSLREFMEDSLGARFSDVRIHHSVVSNAINRVWGSLAFTIYNHIGLRSGFNEECGDFFNYVLAHELVHVLQKRQVSLRVGRFSSLRALEEEARRVAGGVLLGRRPSVSTADMPDVPRFWGPAGHYWTVYLTSMLADWSYDESLENAFNAQMPDQVEELDAKAAGINYYKEWLKTPPVFKDIRDNPSGPWIADTDIQRGLHALTGRGAEEETSIRTKILAGLKRGSFEYGLALHPFGDSFAHRKGNVMYVAHLGHAVEKIRYNEKGWPVGVQDPSIPDYIHKRAEVYEQYGLAMFEILGTELGKENREEKSLKLRRYLREIANEPDEGSQVAKIDWIVFKETGFGHTGYDPLFEDCVPWEKFLKNHRDLSSNLLERAKNCARNWAWFR